MTMDRGDLHPRNSNLGANGASFGNREDGTGFRNGERERQAVRDRKMGYTDLEGHLAFLKGSFFTKVQG